MGHEILSVGDASIPDIGASIEDEVVEGDVYAWGKTAWTLVQPQYERLLSDPSTGDIRVLDVCSAFPYFAQILREHHRQRCYEQARTIAGKFAYSLLHPPTKKDPKPELSAFWKLDDDTVGVLRERLTPRKGIMRRLLEATIQDALYEPGEMDIGGRLRTQTHVYTQITEREEHVGKGRWKVLFADEQPSERELPSQTFAAHLGNILPDTWHVDAIKESVAFLENQCLPLKQNVIVTSLDVADTDYLVQEGKKSFPESYWETHLFDRVRKFSDHIQGDIHDLSHLVSGSSVSLLTSIEGWPFWFRQWSEEEHLSFVQSVHNVLVPDGAALFFPWNVHESGEKREEAVLLAIERNFTDLDMSVTKKSYAHAELFEVMKPRETALRNHSLIFQRPDEQSTALIVQKRS